MAAWCYTRVCFLGHVSLVARLLKKPTSTTFALKWKLCTVDSSFNSFRVLLLRYGTTIIAWVFTSHKIFFKKKTSSLRNWWLFFFLVEIDINLRWASGKGSQRKQALSWTAFASDLGSVLICSYRYEYIRWDLIPDQGFYSRNRGRVTDATSAASSWATAIASSSCLLRSHVRGEIKGCVVVLTLAGAGCIVMAWRRRRRVSGIRCSTDELPGCPWTAAPGCQWRSRRRGRTWWRWAEPGELS